ncbi:MAG: pantetheine-phosphate adenylyltransferase [Kiritimatiellae bacterium]|nr:pantetheine-phosphate adenylyltransferase [Kiritimatiellia bacterium]
MKQSAIYPGTFDPITLGHLDVIERASKIFDHLIVAVSSSSIKKPLFGLEARVHLVQEATKEYGVEVDSFEGLLVGYTHSKGVSVLIRGLRAFSDFEFELQMALTNRKMAPDLETVFLMPKEDYSYISSSTVREIAEFGGDISSFVPPIVQKAVKETAPPKP